MDLIGFLITSVRSNVSCVIIFTTIFTLTFWFLKRSRRQGLRLPPALPSLPILGSGPFLPSYTELPEYFRKTSQKLNSSVFSIWQGSEYTVVLNGREAIKEALVRRSADFADRKPSFTFKHFFTHDLVGITNRSYSDDFRRIHQLILSILKDFGFGQKLMEHRILEEVEDLVERINSLQGEPFDPTEYLNLCTLNVINSIALGQRLPQSDPMVNRMANYYHFFINCCKKVIDLSPLIRFLPKYKKQMIEVMQKYQSQHEYLLKTVKEYLTIDNHSFVRKCLEKEKQNFDVLVLKQILNDLLVAGTETTATSIHWSIYYMANNPEIQNRLRADLDAVVSRDRFPSLDDMTSLPYVEAAMLEVMRIRTVVPLSLMRYTMCDTEVAGYFIPAKTRVITNLHSVHFNPDEWPNPELFNPERFLNSDGQVINRDKIIPFGLGKRSCLGELLARQELFLLFAGLVQRFRIQPPEGQIRVQSQPRLATSLCPTPFLVRLVPTEE